MNEVRNIKPSQVPISENQIMKPEEQGGKDERNACVYPFQIDNSQKQESRYGQESVASGPVSECVA